MADMDNYCFIEEVPDEILLKIFIKLSHSDLICGVAPVCKRWSQLSNDANLWSEIDFSILNSAWEHLNKLNSSKEAENLLFNIQDCVKKITFNNAPLQGEAYELFCRSPSSSPQILLQKLTSLDYSYSFVNACRLRRALSTYPSITELILIHTNITLTEVVNEVLHLSNLKKLIFHDMYAWDNFLGLAQDVDRDMHSLSLIKVPKHCPNLEWVELYTIWPDFDDNVLQQFFEFCPSLKRFNFRWPSHLTEAGFQNSKRENTITHLGIADRLGPGAYLNFVLPHFPRLISLTVNGCQVFSQDCCAIGINCPFLQELIFDIKNLRDPGKSVSFPGLQQPDALLNSFQLVDIASNCRYLRKVHMPCSDVDDESFTYLVKHCQFLDDVNFMSCSRLTVICLYSLSKHSPDLKFVNFQETFITHESEYMHSLLTSCQGLQEIVLDRRICSPHMVSSLQNSTSMFHNSKNKLVSSDPKEENDRKDFIPFIDMSSSLEEEDLSHQSEFLNEKDVSAFTNSSVDPSYFPVLLNHCHLSLLSLKGTDLCNGDLQQIFQLCPDLMYVDLDRCPNLKDETISCLVAHCRNLKVLSISAIENGLSEIGDTALRDICIYSRQLETLSLLNNRNISFEGIRLILNSLERSLEHLTSLSFCIGTKFCCKLLPLEVQWLKYITKTSALSFEKARASQTSFTFRMLHLEFLPKYHRKKLTPETRDQLV